MTIEMSLGIKIRNYRFDGEFNPGPIGRWLTSQGIAFETTEPYRHYQNGSAERQFRTIQEKTAAMLQHGDIAQLIQDITTGRTEEILHETNHPESLWPKAFEHAVWLRNQSPARAL